MSNKKKNPSRRETRSLRFQRLIFIAFGVLIILAMLLSSIR
jgi:hypothetical protein